MAFSDWITGLGGPNSPTNDLDGSGGYPALATSTLTPIESSNTLAISGSGLAGGGSSISNSTAGWAIQNVKPKGFLSGKIRCLINPVDSNPANHGVFSMASSTDMSVLSGMEGYGVILDSILSNNNVRLIHITSGSSTSLGSAAGSTYKLLGSTTSSVWTEDNIYSIELEWHVDARLNGVHLIGRFGVGNDFANLTTFAEVIHTGNATTGPSVGEGIFCNKSINTMAVLFDKIQVFEMPEI